MSTWISKGALIGGLLLCGCAELGTELGLDQGGSPPLNASKTTTVAHDLPTEAQFFGGDITVPAPQGYCVLESRGRETADAGFAMLGDCGVIAQADLFYGELPPSATYLTAAVSAGFDGASVPSGPALKEVLLSEMGRAALARSGRASDLTVTESFVERGAVYLRTEEKIEEGSTLSPASWRAVSPMSGRLVTLGVINLKDKALGQRESLQILKTFMSKVTRANRKKNANPLLPIFPKRNKKGATKETVSTLAPLNPVRPVPRQN